MNDLHRPLLTVHVLWHPDSSHGDIADAIRRHFNREPIAGGGDRMGVSTLFRSAPSGDRHLPAPVDFTGSTINAVVVLAGEEICQDPAWREYVGESAVAASAEPLRHRVFPVSVTPNGLQVTPDVQAFRWHDWPEPEHERPARLVFELTHELAIMLRTYHAHLRDPGQSSATLPPVRVFLSHSKHDSKGTRLATAVRNWLHRQTSLSSFFDVVPLDIPPGRRFEAVLANEVERSAVLAFHTDTYSARPWCKREVLLAKLNGVPLVVASCLAEGDMRAFPYLGNVPVVPMPTQGRDRIRAVVGRLLDEVFVSALWHCLTEPLRRQHPRVRFVPRPPELLLFAHLRARGAGSSLIVYAGAPVGEDEEALFEGFAPAVRSLRNGLWREAHEELA